MTLLELYNGDIGIIQKVKGSGAFRRRIIEMGFVAGQTVTVVKKAPLQDPIQYSLMGYQVSLRSSEAQLIEVLPIEKSSTILTPVAFKGTIIGDLLKPMGLNGKTINVALVGNPNSGKTSFFNHASGSQEKVGNYSGVTVEAKNAFFRHKNYKINITDLPGTYSVSAYTPEEIFIQKFITEQLPDVVINIVDSSNLERNLYLTTQLIDMDIKVVMVLNMYDELERKGDTFDYESLAKMTGIPMVPAVSSRGNGIKEVFDKVIEVYEGKDDTLRHIHINYGDVVENSIRAIQEKIRIPENRDLTDRISSRYLAIKLLEKDQVAKNKIVSSCTNHSDILNTVEASISNLEEMYNDSSETIITDLKYGFIDGALKETYQSSKILRRQKSQIIDTLITDKLFGIPVFLFFMWLMFTVTFTLGSYPMEWIENGVEWLSQFVDANMSTGPLKDLLINGIISGAGGVLVFLPNIVLLFFFISLMEDTGYMSRAVFIMDKVMHKIGLHGKSFIPLLMGFGCNVPAIMATRTLANRNDRLLTMIINPFMSCSARLPVYVLFITAFFPKNQGTILFLIYGTGIMMAVLSALIFKKTLFRGEEVPFVMELPPYRIPTIRSTVKHMWSRAIHYLKKISGIILIASVIIWVLGYFPHGIEYSRKLDQGTTEIENQYNQLITNQPEKESEFLAARILELEKFQSELYQQRQENSLIAGVGKAIAPVMAPLGFDWKMSVSLLSGLAAKEIVVSTLGVLYQAEENVQTQSASLTEKLQSQSYHNGEHSGSKVFTPLVALSFMLFVLLYFPCIGVLAAIVKESGHWKWGLLTVFYTTATAWVVAFIVFQAGKLMGF
jgi:ferrous iron transport protein B